MQTWGHRGMVIVVLFAFAVPLRGEEVDKAITNLIARVKANQPPRPKWDRVVALGKEALLPLLQAMPADDLAVSNWLATAFDRIASQQNEVPIEELKRFALNAENVGRARRLALDAVETKQPGTRERLLAGWLDDAEFRFESVELRRQLAEQAGKAGDERKAKTMYREAFEASRDVNQLQALAEKLREIGDEPDLYSRLGVIRDWAIVGAFRGPENGAFAQRFAPEEKIDLSAKHVDGERTLTWKRVTATAPDGRVDLLPHLSGQGNVAYLVSRFHCPTPRQVELRAGAVDNLTVWLNGKRVLHHGIDYRSQFRLDWHVGKLDLPSGESTLLIKSSRTPAGEERPGRKPKWDVQIRLVDGDGRGVALPSSLPQAK